MITKEDLLYKTESQLMDIYETKFNCIDDEGFNEWLKSFGIVLCRF